MFKNIFKKKFFVLLTPLLLLSCNNSPNNIEHSENEKLSKKEYNDIVDDLKDEPNTLAIAVIYGEKKYVEKVKEEKGKSVWYYLHNKLKDIDFKFHEDSKMGIWIGPFFFKDKPNILLHGTSQNYNYNMLGYPMLYYNHKFANLGASNYHPIAGQIIEVTYNHKS